MSQIANKRSEFISTYNTYTSTLICIIHLNAIQNSFFQIEKQKRNTEPLVDVNFYLFDQQKRYLGRSRSQVYFFSNSSNKGDVYVN